LMKPVEFRQLIHEMGRVPVERSTTYQTLRVFESEEIPPDPLDQVDNPKERFGSYQELVRLKDYRFKDFYRSRKDS